MVFPPELATYIIGHGYTAVFSLIFLQELGMPNPVPNEVILLFAGYLASTGDLSFPLIFLAGVSADIIGTSVLFGVFYYFGERIIKHAPRWLPVNKIERLKARVAKGGAWGVFFGRLLPYLRGYASVAAGLLKIPPRQFFVSVVLSAILWSGGYVLAGRLLGPEWTKFIAYFSFWQVLAIVALIIILVFYIIPYLRRKFNNKAKPLN